MTSATSILLEMIRDAAVAGTSNVTLVINRDLEEEPLSEDADEIPGVNLRMVNLARIEAPNGSWKWGGTVQADVCGGGTTDNTINEQTAAIIADLIAALWGNDAGTLGGFVETLEPELVDASERATPDVGWALLQWRVEFYTPMGRFDSIVPIN